jgi:repressor LexA
VKQSRLLQFVRDYVTTHGYPPSVRECLPVGPWSSVSGVAYQLDELAAKGRIKRGSGPRMITLIPDGEMTRR